MSEQITRLRAECGRQHKPMADEWLLRFRRIATEWHDLEYGPGSMEEFPDRKDAFYEENYDFLIEGLPCLVDEIESLRAECDRLETCRVDEGEKNDRLRVECAELRDFGTHVDQDNTQLADTVKQLADELVVERRKINKLYAERVRLRKLARELRDSLLFGECASISLTAPDDCHICDYHNICTVRVVAARPDVRELED